MAGERHRGSEYFRQKAELAIDQLKARDRAFQPPAPQDIENAATQRQLEELLGRNRTDK